MSKPTSAEYYRFASRYEELQKDFSSDRFTAVRHKPLAYWVTHGDRRLPQAFLQFTLDTVIEKPFDELAATGGVGQKKMGSFLKLLSRIATRNPLDADPADSDGHTNHKPRRKSRDAAGFDADAVSEAMWSRWGEAIREFGADHEPLGRLASSLQTLPSVIWRMPLSWYLNQTLAEIRGQKTHGEKRVRVVIEVVSGVYDIVSKVQSHPYLSVRLAPGFVPPIERWIWQSLSAPERVDVDSIRGGLSSPLTKQIEVDCGPTVARVVERRLPLHPASVPVNTLAKRMGVTRARVYQLIEECEQAIAIRWPEGRCLLALLEKQLAETETAVEPLRLLRATSEVFFPSDRQKTPLDADAAIKDCVAITS